jgi:Fic family protein
VNNDMVNRKIQMAQALLTASQAKIDGWLHAIDTVISQKPDIQKYIENKNLLMPKLLEARAKGVTLRELATITGIPHQTIAKWLKQAKEKDYIKEAKELVASTEQAPNAKT